MRQVIEDYCSKIGKDSDFVQGAGGNVSWKEEGNLWIKASGTWLSDANQQDIFVAVDLNDVKQQLSSGNFDINPKSPKGLESSLRPSIETVLHAVMPQKVVSHTHLIDALVYLVQPTAKEQLDTVMTSGLSWGIVPYAKPGPDLGESVFELLKDKPLDVIFLSNHGVIIGGDSVEDVEQKYTQLRQDLAVAKLEFTKHLSEQTSAPNIDGYTLHLNAIQQGLAHDPSVLDLISKRWALYPDHIVFLGFEPQLYPSLGDFQSQLSDPSKAPDYAIIPNVGVYVKTDINKNKLAMLDFYYQMLKHTYQIQTLSTLTENDIANLLNWDAEKYRQQIAK